MSNQENKKEDKDFVHILIEEHNGLKVGPSIKMRELSETERAELLKSNQIYLCKAEHALMILKDNVVYDIAPYTKIYHPNQGRNATFN